MPLDPVVDTVDALPEPVRQLYRQQSDGTYALDLPEDMSRHPSVARLTKALDEERAARKARNKEVAELKAKLPDDFDPDEYRQLRELARKFETEGEGHDGGEAQDGEGEARQQAQPGGNGREGGTKTLDPRQRELITRPLIARHQRELSAEQRKAQAAIEEANRFRNMVYEDRKRLKLDEALAAVNTLPTSLRMARALHMQHVRVQDDGDGVRVYYHDPELNEERPVEDAIRDWANTPEGREHVAAPQNYGGGASNTGRSAGPNPFIDKDPRTGLPSRTAQNELIARNPAEARRLAKAAGVTPDW